MIPLIERKVIIPRSNETEVAHALRNLNSKTIPEGTFISVPPAWHYAEPTRDCHMWVEAGKRRDIKTFLGYIISGRLQDLIM